MAVVVCPICRKKFETAESDGMPFCSRRCKEIDLGRWLGERYAFPTSRTDDEEGEGDSAEEPPADEE